MKKIMGILAMAVLSVSLVACGGSSETTESAAVTISGSSSVNALMEELEPVFESSNEMIDLKVS
ncbi:MAG: MetQ/NlpA family ABC transporter substrate-binding protein, partial [Culicoidibacterales bacterium]